MIQLARKLTNLTIIGTADPQKEKRARDQGEHHVNGCNGLSDQLQQVGIPAVAYIASLTHTNEHLKEISDVVLPQWRLAIIDDPVGLDTMILKPKSVSVLWEFMFTRSLFQTPDMIEQHNTLNRVSELVDRGEVTTPLGENLGTITATNLKRACIGRKRSGKWQACVGRLLVGLRYFAVTKRARHFQH